MATWQQNVIVLRDAQKSIESEEDRKLFRSLVANKPGPGAPITRPTSNGFLDLEELFSDDDYRSKLATHVKGATQYAHREEMFSEMVSLVHKLSQGFSVFIGRTYLRKKEEHKGPESRFLNQMNVGAMQWGMVFARVNRSEILADENLARVLTDVWSKVGALCCNRKCLLKNGVISDDKTQLIYICIADK